MRRPHPSSPSDLCVVGGAGHVGLPLALVFASKGMRVLLYDTNGKALAGIRAGRMPHREEGADSLLARALAKGLLRFSSSPSDLAGIPAIVITIGTPIDAYNNPGMGPLTDCLDRMLPFLSDQQTLVLRSTVAPGVTEFLGRHLRRRGRRIPLAFCPERVVQGMAVREIQTLPQLVSGTSPRALKVAKALFRKVAPEVVEMTPREAEYAKLICNAYRYIQFAATNQLYMMVESAGLDYNALLRKMKRGYPRMGGMPGPGFAAGPCLMKDTQQLFAQGKHHFVLGQIATAINEGLPHFIVETLARRFNLTRTRVGILGMAFKADSDDIRDSLSYKLGKILRFAGATVRYSDEFVQDPTFIPKERLVASCDVVILGVPHSAYRRLKIPARVALVDMWGVIPGRRGRGRA